MRATFFIPGWVVEAHPAMCEAILKDGHEIGHHGYLHKRPDPADLAHDIEEVDRGLEALKRVLGVVPVGYRAPSGENHDGLLRHLRDRGILYSSSWRDDIRPYRHRLRDGSAGPVELPISISFDDWFRAAAGLAPIEYVQCLRLEGAKQPLETTDLPVAEVAEAVGYEDAGFFRRLFRRRVGLTPAAYGRRFRPIARAAGTGAALPGDPRPEAAVPLRRQGLAPAPASGAPATPSAPRPPGAGGTPPCG